MLDELQSIADTLYIPFLFGEQSALNVIADWTDSDLIFYAEGYVSGSVSFDLQGSFVTAYTVNLWVLRQSNLSDLPKDRPFAELLATGKNVIRQLLKNYRIDAVQFKEGANLTDRNLDGVRFSFTATPKEPEPSC